MACRKKIKDECNLPCTWINGNSRKYCRTAKVGKRKRTPFNTNCKGSTRVNCPLDDCHWIGRTSRSRPYCKSKKSDVPELVVRNISSTRKKKARAKARSIISSIFG